MRNIMTEERLEFKDDFIKKFVEKGNRTISNKDFENQIMDKIYATTAYKKDVASKLNQSKIFFYCGLSLIVISMVMTILSKLTSSNASSFISILTLFFIMVFGIIFAENYKRLCTNAAL